MDLKLSSMLASAVTNASNFYFILYILCNIMITYKIKVVLVFWIVELFFCKPWRDVV
jgi:hypothetical protein